MPKTMVQARLHQAGFRKATLSAYDDQCAICELRERPLLDAAHIVPDRLPDSVPEVRNRLAMCLLPKEVWNNFLASLGRMG